MTPIVFLLAGFVLAFFAVQAAMTLKFLGVLRKWKQELIADDRCPKATVILCLRGKDPFLEDCLNGILNQDYPCYEVRVIVDHEDDPAHEAAQKFLSQQPGPDRLKISLLTNRRETCSLKCSSLIEAVDQIDEDCEIIALLDADTVPHPAWLRELATSLQPAEIGAATGNRWYVSETASLGSLARYLWNAFAIVQMYQFRIPWGGSLALKTDVVRKANLTEFWSNAFCEDTMLYEILKEQGLRIAFVPSVLMANREDCELEDLYGWIQRQLLTVRLYHPWWLAVVIHGLLTGILPVCIGMALVTCLGSADWQAVSAITGLGVAYGLGMGGLLIVMEFYIRRIFGARDESVTGAPPIALARFPVAVLLLQALYPAALMAALFLRKTVWRGIGYRINGPWKIQRLNYQPYSPEMREADKSL